MSEKDRINRISQKEGLITQKKGLITQRNNIERTIEKLDGEDYFMGYKNLNRRDKKFFDKILKRHDIGLDANGIGLIILLFLFPIIIWKLIPANGDIKEIGLGVVYAIFLSLIFIGLRLFISQKNKSINKCFEYTCGLIGSMILMRSFIFISGKTLIKICNFYGNGCEKIDKNEKYYERGFVIDQLDKTSDGLIFYNNNELKFLILKKEQEILKTDKDIEKINQDIEKIKTKEYLLGLDPYEFEYYIGGLYKAMGYTTRVTKGSNDEGVDVHATNATEKIIIQCKQYSGNIGPNILRELVGTLQIHKGTKGCIATTGTILESSRKIARDHNIDILDINEITYLANKYL